MTRFKRELIKRGVTVEETLPFLPYEHTEAIIVHSDTCIVSTYDNRIGWFYEHYDRTLNVDSNCFEGEEWVSTESPLEFY